MRAHAPTLAVFSVLSLAVLAITPITGTKAAPRQDAPASEAVGDSAFAEPIAGPAEIVDGDSIKILGISIRLHGIDAPEMTQDCTAAPPTGPAKAPVPRATAETWRCGLEAKRALAHLIAKSDVACAPVTLDKYGRTVARCAVPGQAGPVDLNAEMVRQGYAWAFVRYSSDYVEIEKEARAARRGIWRAETQTAWDFRATKWQAAEAVAPDGCTIKGNVTWKGERIYHLPWSPWYTKVRMDDATFQRKGKRWFCSETEAQEAGWRPSATR
jgi:endonuclease YncB( thermonuclease family)